MQYAIRCAFALALLAGVAWNQNISSSIKGTISDPTGAMVVGASCTLTNQATGYVMTGSSWSDGSFTFPNVLAGAYTLKIRAEGFKVLTIKDIVITGSEIRVLGNLTLDVGEIKDTVSVTAEPAAIQLASAERAGLVTGSQLNDIAIKGRDFFSFLSTIPGIVDTSGGGREATDPGATGSSFINGNRADSKNVMVDGITDIDTGSNNAMHFEPNMDAVSEVKVLTSNYQAEYGRNAGGTISVITKSGTREFHGSAYDFYRHESLNANNFFNNRTNTPKNPYRYRISGYSLGGPVYLPNKFNNNRDKLFFFWSQEFTGTKVDYGTRFVNMPTNLERGGDFSQSYDVNGALIAVKDPLTGKPFPDNVIPKNRATTMGQAVLNFFPEPNYTDPDPRNLYRRNYRASASAPYPKRQEILKLDVNPTSSLQAYYRFVNSKDEQQPPFGSWVNNGVNFELTPILYSFPGKGHVAHVTKMFSSTLINESNFGFSQNALLIDPVNKEAISRARMGNLPQWYEDKASAVIDPGYMPDVAFGGQPSSTVNANLANVPWRNKNNIWIFSNNLSKVTGKHQLKAGIYIEKTDKMDPSPGNYRGSYNFSRNTNNPFDTGHSYANALLGYFSSYTESTARPPVYTHSWNFEWFAQDNWRVGRRLTLDFGLRVYHWTAPVDELYTMSTIDPSLWDRTKAPALYYPAFNSTGARVARDPLSGALVPEAFIGRLVPGSGNFANGAAIGGKNGYPRGLETYPGLTFGPRFGFAYDVFGNGKTAVRGGYGLFYDRVRSGMNIDTAGNPPTIFTSTAYYGNLETVAQSGGVMGPVDTLGLLGKISLPSVMNFSLGVQQSIWQTVVEASYVGGLSRHLYATRNINAIPMFARFDPANGDPTRPGQPLPDNFLRPRIGYGNINIRQPQSSSNYNSLQLSANRRFTGGLQFGLAYTFAKALGVASGDNSQLSSYFADRSWNYGPLPFDRSHVLVFNYMYAVPKVGSKVGFKPAEWVLDNWQISGITSFISGAPFTPGFSTTDGQDITGSAEGARITVVGDPNLSKDEKTFFRNFDTSVFHRTPKGSFGNAGVNILRGPGVNNWDIAASKRVPLGSEQRFLQFRTELFNAWNHTQFSGLYSTARFNEAGEQVDPNFGAYSSARTPRIIQLSLKLFF